MWLFYVLTIMTLLLGYLIRPEKSQHNKKKYIVIMFTVFSFLMMFKGAEVGNDTDSYLHIYELVAATSNFKQLLLTSRYEPGFLLFVKLICVIFENPQWLFITSGLFLAFSFGRFIYKYSDSPSFSILIFLTLSFFDLCMSGLRQALAVAILTFAYDALLEKRLVKFSIIVIFATLIHNSSILFLIIYPLARISRTKEFYLISTIVSVIVFFSFERLIVPLISSSFTQYSNYFNRSTSSYSNETKLASVLMTFLLLAIFVIIKSVDVKSETIKNEDYCDQRQRIIDELAIWLGVIMLFLSWKGTILNRYRFVFSFVEITAFPNSVKLIKNQNNSFLISFFSGIVFIMYALVIYYFRPEWQSTYPFIPFWY